MRKMQFHPGRLGIMTPKGEMLPEGDIQRKIREEDEKRKELEKEMRMGSSVYYSGENLRTDYAQPQYITKFFS